MQSTSLTKDQYERAIAQHGVHQQLYQLADGSFEAELITREVNSTVMYCDHFNKGYVTYLEPPAGTVGLVLPHSPRGPLRASGETLAAYDMKIAPANSDGTDLIVPDDTTAESISIPEARFNKLAEVIDPHIAVLNGMNVISGDRAQLQEICSHIRTIVARPEHDPDHVRFDNLIAECIAWFGQSVSDTRQANYTANRRKQHIARQAQAFFEDNYTHVVRMEDVCKELGVGLRKLQRCFADYFQMTPYQYPKTLRYNKARRGLLASDPATHSVTEIAMDNGFYHFGRFAVEYRTLFGEPPRNTLLARTCQVTAPLLEEASATAG